jgi:hypothetical protein
MEAVCLVAYEVAKIDITIRTDNSLAILCPKEFIYVGIPTIHNVYVHNAGLLIGCFYFLKPAGQDADKIRVRFQPQSEIVQAGGTVEVKVELVAVDCGVFENIHVPCFVGDPDRLISLRILCTVSTINVHFYLPNRDRGYDRYLWPPKSDNLPTWDYTVVASPTAMFYCADVYRNSERMVTGKATKGSGVQKSRRLRLRTRVCCL